MPLPIISPISLLLILLLCSSLLSSDLLCIYIYTSKCMGQRWTIMSLFCCCILSLLLLFASVHSVRRTEARALLESQEVAKGQREEGSGVEAAMIGSRPPRCEGRCLSCGQCEAVQVPAIPQERTPAAAVSSRGDDGSSIYKPLSWKCKCGGMILNP